MKPCSIRVDQLDRDQSSILILIKDYRVCYAGSVTNSVREKRSDPSSSVSLRKHHSTENALPVHISSVASLLDAHCVAFHFYADDTQFYVQMISVVAKPRLSSSEEIGGETVKMILALLNFGEGQLSPVDCLLHESDGDASEYSNIVYLSRHTYRVVAFENKMYQKAWREYVKFRHLLANMPKPSFEDKRRLEAKENRLQEMRMTSKMKRDVTIAVSSQGFFRTGIMCDVV
ncbi:ribonuclease 3-like 2, partial [Homarus americanus]